MAGRKLGRGGDQEARENNFNLGIVTAYETLGTGGWKGGGAVGGASWSH